MEGQLSLFPETKEKQANRISLPKLGRKAAKDPSQEYDERMKRFLHYMDIKGMDERWIETSKGELTIVIDALTDYCNMIDRSINVMEAGYAKAAWEERMERLKKIQAKLEESTGYNRDRQLEKCMKRKCRKEDDISEDALVLASKGRS